MRPWQFLDLADMDGEFQAAAKANVDRDGYTQVQFVRAFQRMVREQPMDPAYLDVEDSTCRVVDHEGRHRATVAQALGFPTMPVILRHFGEDGKPTEPTRQCAEELKGKPAPCDLNGPGRRIIFKPPPR